MTVLCPSCRKRVEKLTRDHIMPRVWGGSASFYGAALGIRNVRKICYECNSLRAACRHCDGAMVCVRAVSEARRAEPFLIARRWFGGLPPAASKRGMRDAIRAAGLAPPLAEQIAEARVRQFPAPALATMGSFD